MIDFQDDGLEHQVYELIAKMCDLACSDEFPRFMTRHTTNGRWECNLSIPGVKTDAISYGKTEVEAINNCALDMLRILETDHNMDRYNPDIEESIFKSKIEQFFDDVDYDKRYKYRLCETDILIKPHSELANTLLEKYAHKTINNLQNNGEEVESMSEIVTLRLLVKEKKNYC